MKKLILFSLLTLFLFSACESDFENKIFDHKNGQTLAQLTVNKTSLPTPAEGATLELEVLVTTKSNVDRTISINIDDSVENAAPTSAYTISNLVIPANSFSGKIRIESNYSAVPEQGSIYLAFSISDIENSNPVIDKGNVEIELYRKCLPITGEYSVILYDVYCDGWQGSKLVVNIDGVETAFSIPDGARVLDNCGGPGSIGDQTLTVPADADTITFTWVSGAYPEECAFEVYDSNGTLILQEGNPDDYDTPPANGVVPFNPCNF